ncbi:hypothetical protein [Actinoplanes sp. NPDC049599]|uniref:hypothetical protein n=1 Tax=Actinoplanes sp. NPDC049599 TaxID=3363903 RepID=UPI0037ACDFC2
MSDAVVQQVGRPKISWWQVLRVVLVLGWVAWAALTWWMAPRESTAAQARADIAAQRLTYYEWGDGWQNDGGLVSPFPAGLEQWGGPGPMLLWHTTDGRRHFTTIDEPTAAATGVVGTLLSGPEATALDQELQAYETRRPADPPTGAVQGGLLIAGSVLFLWALVSAAEPVTGTKWFWFWLVSGVPLGLGLLWWLARERPWSSRAAEREPRLRWWAGIGIGILAGLVVSLAL